MSRALAIPSRTEHTLSMPFKSPIGLSDFRSLREGRFHYVDKTQLITELVERGVHAVLFPRPRRFGKTLMQSTLRYFFEVSDEDLSWMYEDLEVWQSEEARSHFQRHPVIELSLKSVKSSSWEETLRGIREVVAEETKRHLYLLHSEALISQDKTMFQSFVDRNSTLSELMIWPGLLARWLYKHHGEKTAILLDEYDIPIQAAYAHGFYGPAIDFFRNFITAGFKDTDSFVFKGVLTGVLGIAKESMFSGPNNIPIHSILTTRYATAFGFTQQEVDDIVARLDTPEGTDSAQDVREWYNGYQFAGNVIYNPWSVLRYAEHPENGSKAYWTFTGSDDVLRTLVLGKSADITEDLETLMNGGGLQRIVKETMVLRNVERNADAIWTLLLMSGYLTTTEAKRIDGDLHAKLVIPNREVMKMYRQNIVTWTDNALGTGLPDLFKSMFAGDEEVFGEVLGDLVAATFSYHDIEHSGPALDPSPARPRKRRARPELVYQAFVLGMLVHLRDNWRVTSNRESGYGRYDVAVTPRKSGAPGAVFEFKVLRADRGETLDSALDSALKQLAERNYVKELEEVGAEPIVSWGVVFDGKRVWVKKAS